MEELTQKYTPYFLEIRKRLFFIVSLFLVAAGIGFFFYEKIISFSFKLFQLDGINVVFTSPFQFMDLAISCAVLVGIIAIFPLLIIQILAFIRPALTKKEYKLVVRAIPISIFLFILGFAFGATMMKYVLDIFYAKATSLNIGNFLDISKLISQILITSALMGLGFQFPVVITILIHLKITTAKFIAKQRIYAYAAALLFAAFMPPTDLLSLIILTLPLVLLYEATLILNRFVLKP